MPLKPGRDPWVPVMLTIEIGPYRVSGAASVASETVSGGRVEGSSTVACTCAGVGATVTTNDDPSLAFSAETGATEMTNPGKAFEFNAATDDIESSIEALAALDFPAQYDDIQGVFVKIQ